MDWGLEWRKALDLEIKMNEGLVSPPFQVGFIISNLLQPPVICIVNEDGYYVELLRKDCEALQFEACRVFRHSIENNIKQSGSLQVMALRVVVPLRRSWYEARTFFVQFLNGLGVEREGKGMNVDVLVCRHGEMICVLSSG